MKIIIIFVATILYVMLFTRTAFASDIQIFLPIISNQSLHELEEGFNYMAEVPHANSPLSATIQIDVFDKCGACGWEHRLAGIYVEIVYVQGNTTLSTTLQTDWEGVARFDQRYDQATIRIIKDANGNPVTSSTVNVFYRDPRDKKSDWIFPHPRRGFFYLHLKKSLKVAALRWSPWKRRLRLVRQRIC